MCRIIKSAVILLIALMNIGAVATAFAQDATSPPLPGAIFTTDDGCLQVNGNVWYESKKHVYLTGGPAKKDDSTGLPATGLPDRAYFVRVIEPGQSGNKPKVLGTSGSNRPIIVVDGHFKQCYQLWNIVKYKKGSQEFQGYADTSNRGGEYQVEVSTVDFTDPNWSASNKKSDNFKVRKGTPTTWPGIDIELECPSSVWAGQTITYKMRAHNTGNVPLFNVTISGTVNGVQYGPLPNAAGVTLGAGAYSEWMEYKITKTSAGDYEYSATARGVYDTTVDPPGVVIKSGSCSAEAFALTVEKTAKTKLDRTYTWTVTKSVDPTAVQVGYGVTEDLTYTVKTSSTSVDSKFVLYGTITIKNPAPFDAVLSSITDTISEVSISELCSAGSIVPHAYPDPVTGVVTDGKLTCHYTTGELGTAPSGTKNTATVTIDDVADPSFSGSVNFSFNDATVTPIHGSVTATDVATPDCPDGFTCSDRPAPWFYTGEKGDANGDKTYDDVKYIVSLTNNSFCGWTTLDNTVTLRDSADQTMDWDSASVTLFGNVKLGAGGGLTLGYWSNKNGQATMDSGGMAGELAMLTALNLRTANGDPFDPDGYDAFRTWILDASATNMAYMLSAQLAAMELNVYNGSVDEGSFIYAPGTKSANAFVGGYAQVLAVMIEANTELGRHGLTLSGSPDRSYQEALKKALDDANNNVNFVQKNCSQ